MDAFADDRSGLEHALEQWRTATYQLQLFVCGMSPRSTDAIANLTAVCEQYLPGRYSLQVIDLYTEPHRAKEERLFAAPTLLRVHPLPVRRAVGDLRNTERLLGVLELM